MKKIYLIFVVLLVACTRESESQESRISEQNLVLLMIKEWFLHPGLDPIIEVKKPVELEGYALVDTKNGPCVQVVFSQKGVTYDALLALGLKPLGGYRLHKLYFSPHNLEYAPEPQLFYDIVNTSCLIFNDDLKKKYSVFIEQADIGKKDKKTYGQVWTFFNSTEKKKVFVYLMPDDKGETDYAVQLWKE